ncbi:MAG: glycoside hydrolase family 35 protein [Vulcanimicrobiaceae bacterium]
MERKAFVMLGLAQSAWFALGATGRSAPAPGRLEISGTHFVLDGKPLQILSGEMHYARIPREYWRDRLRMARAMGLNTVSTYVFWNVHEPRPEEYVFSDGADVAAFARAAQEEGLHVILRPGPYSCAEWEFGGYPAWLLADPQTVVRSRDERFMGPARRWLKRLGQELSTLQYARGGPIVAMQVENEYGSYGDDHAYMAQIRDALTAAGFDDVYRYTADGGDELPAGTLPELPCVANFGPGDAKSELAKLQRFRSTEPVMCGEYWCGWFDHWGEPHRQTDAEQQAQELAWMLSQGYSVNLYMFHGGTNFGFMNGANYSKERPYQPTTTSYDYDAPLDEGGHPTRKYDLFRDAIAKHFDVPPAAPPPRPKRAAFAPFTLDESAPFRSLLAAPVHSDRPLTFEALGQDYGYVLYRATIARAGRYEVAFGDVRDYAVVFVDGVRADDLDRRLGQRSMHIETTRSGATLEVLVENSGRINFGRELATDRKGIFGPVMLSDAELTGWSMYRMPMNDLSALQFAISGVDAPAFYRGTFTLKEPADTFLDVRTLGKGMLWVNGRAAGRFWSIGPQYALYVPKSWLRSGANEVVVFDVSDRSIRTLEGRTQPLYAPLVE